MADFTINANDVIESTFVGEYQGQMILNVFHFNKVSAAPATGGVATLLALNGWLHDNYWNRAVGLDWQQLVVTDYILRIIRSQVVRPVRLPYIEAAYNEAGTQAPPGAPSDTNLTVSMRTLRTQKGTVGNKKFTGLRTNRISGNVWVNDEITDFQTWASAALLESPDPIGPQAAKFDPIVWSPRRASDRAGIFSVTARPEVRVLRRRMRGLGV